MVKKEKKPTIKDEAIEAAYRRCKSEAPNDPTCEGLLAQSKAGMMSTDQFLEGTQSVVQKARRKKKKASTEKSMK